ncbi:hypothetical protein TNCV_3059371 [Trichonephila clavipes]|nr:hypothetical protein TNCV_3059371 [Trichonephila clavipes]
MEKVVDLAKQINLEVNSDDVQELLDSHNLELTIDELIEMHEQGRDIEELSLNLFKSENRITVGNLTTDVVSSEWALYQVPSWPTSSLLEEL